ncbi:MAG: N-acetyl-gamma-glutamyl-phosphate reductase [Microbacteriaceae bacterium]|nr:N-acetyl-gamma-glutamyl-phosphate reductase [Microbacteriaceae bacterium]
MFTVAIIGASGYAGGEVARLVSAHPQLELVSVTAASSVGKGLWDMHPQLTGALPNLIFQETSVAGVADADIVFLALPHGQSGEIASSLPADKIVIDLGADHRLQSTTDWNTFYGGAHHEAWAYAVPEIPLAEGGKLRDLLPGAKRIAGPGCNASTVSLALAPAIRHGLVSGLDITANLAVGTSGAGRKAATNLLASEIIENAKPYSVGGIHRHIPEIAQTLRTAGASEVSLSFTPVLVPMSRGILATVTARPLEGVTEETLRAAYEEEYGREQFINLLPAGVWPASRQVLGSNMVQIGITLDQQTGRLVAIAAVDNLYKGTAGAAIQALNISLGLDESLGLSKTGVAP